MIDFAKSMRLPKKTPPLNHRDSWHVGNHEDGYLYGLDNLIEVKVIHCSNLINLF